MELGEKKLVVQRASVGAHKHDHTAPSTMFMPMVVKEDDATRVVQLMNMVTPEELEDDEEYQGMCFIWMLNVGSYTKHLVCRYLGGCSRGMWQVWSYRRYEDS